MKFDILSLVVILIDLSAALFIGWRVLDKNATLWGTARFIYGWVFLLTAYHGVIYTISMFSSTPEFLIHRLLHLVVALYVLNPLLIAIIHWKGGRL